jgi:hypothetical protein
MKTKYNIIFSKSECPSSDTLIKYSEKILSNEQMRSVELHLSDCIMCSDEIEGFNLLQNKEKLPIIISQLNKKIDERIKHEKGFKIFKNRRIYAIAASFILLLSSGYFLYVMYGNSYNDMAENIPSQTEQKSAFEGVKADSGEIISYFEENKKDKISENKNMPSEKNSVSNTNIGTTTNQSSISEPVVTENNILAEENLNDKIASRDENIFKIDEGISDANLSKKEKEVINDDDKSDEDRVFSSTSRDSNKSKNNNDKNVNSSASGESNGIAIFDIKENNTSQIYNEALNLYNNKKYEEAIVKFDSVISSKNKFKEESEWHKALSLINLNKNEQAKIILNKIIEEKGKFAAQAKEKLNEL